jgi:hypothetical protein
LLPIAVLSLWSGLALGLICVSLLLPFACHSLVVAYLATLAVLRNQREHLAKSAFATFHDELTPSGRTSAGKSNYRACRLTARQHSSHILYIVFLRLDFSVFFLVNRDFAETLKTVRKIGIKWPVFIKCFSYY